METEHLTPKGSLRNYLYHLTKNRDTCIAAGGNPTFYDETIPHVEGLIEIHGPDASNVNVFGWKDEE